MITYIVSILVALGLMTSDSNDALSTDQLNTLIQDNKTEIYDFDQDNARILSWDNDEEIY